MATLIRCPGCNQLRSPAALPCPTCASQQRRARNTLAIACAILGLCLLLLLLTSCTGDPAAATGGIQPPPRHTLAELRAQSFGTPAAIPTLIIPAPLPPDETNWARQTIQLDYRWCAAGQLQGGAQPQPNHPACPQ